MARYPQGVSTFIPQIQPYQVDFNFVNNILQAKQNQYDQNWKQLNKLYGQIYYADLTHDESKEKQKAIVNEIDFNLKRVSGLDLSLDQNVQAAQQVFQPFYQDANLMKDMAWTKNTKAQLNTGEALRSSSEEDRRGQYWRTGIDAINYRMQEFKETPYDQIQSIGNVKYTPYVDVMKRAEEMAKEYGDHVTPSFEGGKWIVKTTNGEQLLEPLSKLFNIRLGGDPFIKDMYQTQAYVKRKSYMDSEAANFNGDKALAERNYLQDGYNRMKESVVKENRNLKQQLADYEKNLDLLEEKQMENPTNPQIDAAVRELLYNKRVIEENLKQSDATLENYNTGSSNGTTSTGYNDPFADIGSLRRRVDSLVANDLFNRDVGQAAEVYAYRNFKQEFEENPYGLADYKHQLRLETEKYKADRAQELKMDELKLDTGDFRLQVDEKGNVAVVPKDERFHPQQEMLTDPGFTTGKLSTTVAQQNLVDDLYRDNILPALTQQLNMLNQSTINKQTLASYFSGTDLNTLVKATQSVEAFNQAIKDGKIKKGTAPIKTKEEALHYLQQSIESIYGSASNRQTLLNNYEGKEELLESTYKTIYDYDKQMQLYGKWNKKAVTQVATDAKTANDHEVSALIKSDGGMRSVKEWAQELRNQGVITENDKNLLIANKGVARKPAKLTVATRPEGDWFYDIYGKIVPDLWGPGTGLLPNLLTPASSITEPIKDVYGNDLSSYSTAAERLKTYKIDYGKVGPSPIIQGQLNPGDPTAFSNITGSSIVAAGKGGTYERFMKDIFNNTRGMDLGQPNSFGTYDNPAMAVDKASIHSRSTQRTILDAIESELQNEDSKMSFKVIASPIAGREINLASITFKASDPKFWEQFGAKSEKSEDFVLVGPEIAAVKKNGYSIVADRSFWNNQLLSHSLKGAVLSAAEADPNGVYEYKNPFDDRFKTVVQLNKKTGNVGMTTFHPEYNYETLSYETVKTTEPMISSSNLDERVNLVNTIGYLNNVNSIVDQKAKFVEALRQQNPTMSDQELRILLQQLQE